MLRAEREAASQTYCIGSSTWLQKAREDQRCNSWTCRLGVLDHAGAQRYPFQLLCQTFPMGSGEPLAIASEGTLSCRPYPMTVFGLGSFKDGVPSEVQAGLKTSASLASTSQELRL